MDRHIGGVDSDKLLPAARAAARVWVFLCSEVSSIALPADLMADKCINIPLYKAGNRPHNLVAWRLLRPSGHCAHEHCSLPSSTQPFNLYIYLSSEEFSLGQQDLNTFGLLKLKCGQASLV